MGRVIAEAIVHEFGRDELLRRLAHPFWFQSFGAVMGMDWHSSGITTSVIGALKRLQQGMNEDLREARRYHWQSDRLPGFFESPHSAIEGRNVGAIVNLADVRAERSRAAGLELALSGPHRSISILKRFQESGNAALSLFPETEPVAPPLPHLRLPHHHEVRASDVMLKRLHGTLAAAAEAGPKDYADLLLMPGVGARTIEALAFVAEVVHGTPSRFSDPARFSLALGSKDGHPFPVPITVFDETIRLLKRAVDRAKLGSTEALAAIQRLDAQARMLESRVSGPAFEDFIAAERAKSPSFGGRTVSSSRRD